MKSYSLMIPAPARLLTTNAERKLHYQERANIVRRWRALAKIMARAARVPHFASVELTVSIAQAKGRLADIEAHHPTVKACIDGLVDAGVIDDDDPEHVTSITNHPPRRSGLIDEVTIVITGEPTPRPTEYTAADVLTEMQGKKAQRIARQQRDCPHVKRLAGVCIECGHGAP